MPYTYSVPEIYVCGKVQVVYGPSAWNYNHHGAHATYNIYEGSDNMPISTDYKNPSDNDRIGFPSISTLDLGGASYGGNADVCIQRWNGSSWVNEFNTNFTVFYGDRPWQDVRVWEKTYDKLTKIRPYINIKSIPSVRERRIDMYIIREKEQ